MEHFYTNRSNARRAAKKAGVDPDLVFAVSNGFAFTPKEEVGLACYAPTEPTIKDAIDVAIERGISPKEFAALAEQVADDLDAKTEARDDDVPAFLKIPAAERKAGWDRNPPKAKAKQEATMPKAKTTKAKAASKPASSKPGAKTAELLKMLKGKGATVDSMCKALGWLPHTLRARLSRLPKENKGLKIERSRVDGVTSYRAHA